MKQEQIFAEYIDHMGTDLTVVNAARASFGKESQWEPGSILSEDGGRNLKPADANLIRFLATGYRKAEWDDFLDELIHLADDPRIGYNDRRVELTKKLHAYKRKAQHWAPFAHPQVQIRVRMPLFLARQFVKHQVGGVWSEESRRYLSNEPGVWFPDEWHTRPEDIKQGSGDVVERRSVFIGDFENVPEAYTERGSVQYAINQYNWMLSKGVAPEEARIVLPLNMMTTVVWTGSLLFWSRVVNQRVDSHAQLAAQELGKLIAGIVAPLFPVSWSELV